MITNLNQIAREIIKNNQYVTIASLDKDDSPWISPVAYTFDKQYNLYFLSMPNSRHSQNLGLI